MSDYRALQHLLGCFFNPDWGFGHEESMRMLGRQMQVTQYVDELKAEFARSFDDDDFSWLKLFVERRLDEAYGLRDERAVRLWVKKYVWPEVFTNETPLVRDS